MRSPAHASAPVVASAALLHAAIRLALWFTLRPSAPASPCATAFRFATAGLGLVLVGPNPEKLAADTAESKAKHRTGIATTSFKCFILRRRGAQRAQA